MNFQNLCSCNVNEVFDKYNATYIFSQQVGWFNGRDV